MSKRALILVDLQNDYFPDGKWPLVGIDAAAGNAARILAAAREAGDLVIHVRHESTRPGAPFFVPGSDGARTSDVVAASPGEIVVVKNNINAFLRTDLRQVLENAGVDKVTVLGAMSHMCIDAATRAASDFGYPTTVIHDACATRDLAFNGVTVPAAHVHAAFMAALGFAYATLTSTDEYLAA